MIQIIGLFLVKNEDIHIEWSIRNVVDFCDKIYVCDNYSTDGTWKILKALANEFPKIELHQILQAKQSHSFVEKYAGTPTWVFAVDGDEVYDPIGLKSFRKMLLSGEYLKYFKLVGNTLHAGRIDFEAATAIGYLAPPAKNVTKLYNFNAILSWVNTPYERLHGGEIVFREGYHAELRCLFADDYRWENSPYRCLHACFMRRSSQELEQEIYARLIPDERIATRSFWRSLWNWIRGYDPGLEKNSKSNWKLAQYAVGEKKEKSIDSFLKLNGHKKL